MNSPETPSKSDWLIGVDLAQTVDWTAIIVLQRYLETPSRFHVRHIERLQRVPYPAIVERVKRLKATPHLSQAELVLDKTGCGAPVTDMFSAAGLPSVPITITAGNEPHCETGEWHVPKRDLVSTIQVLLQTGRLRVAEGLPDAQTLVSELLSFQVNFTAAGNDTYGCWREGTHDDLVLATALAAWYGTNRGTPPVVLIGKERDAGGFSWDRAARELQTMDLDPTGQWTGVRRFRNGW